MRPSSCIINRPSYGTLCCRRRADDWPRTAASQAQSARIVKVRTGSVVVVLTVVFDLGGDDEMGLVLALLLQYPARVWSD
jgi:hypothetical protein